MNEIRSTDEQDDGAPPRLTSGFIYTGPQNPCVWPPHVKPDDPSLRWMARALLDAAQDGARYYCAARDHAVLFRKEAGACRRIAP